ncbi:putative transcription factor WD40-like family [Lupinus albus]|uniref:Putative transcription factor WD40-like family n=1 Tax=Lupinus albus TaxID=3870 RepID=A0A6A4R9R3_LUPAL|nr:putative transcription factor WD40-like family [Lupinus albus]
MYQWRKFDFFEEKYTAKCGIPEDDDVNTKKIQCCSSGRGKVVTGFDDGTVCFFDRGFNFNYAFQPHSSSVLFLQQLKQRNFLVTIGEDEQLTPQQSALCLKVFDLDKMQAESSSTTSPDCVGILRIFTNQFPEAKITSFLVLEEVPPILLIVIGLDNGSIYCIKGDIARERINRFKLQVENHSDKTLSFVTGLGFKVDGRSL